MSGTRLRLAPMALAGGASWCPTVHGK
jgi:hypothetical protein